jgi:hypothetical protein
MNWKFWKKEIKPKQGKECHKDWCPLFRGNGSKVFCIGTLETRTPYFVHDHCKNRDNPCIRIIQYGFPSDVQLRKGEHYAPSLKPKIVEEKTDE